MREIKFEYISEFERFNHEKDDFEKYFVKQVLTLQDIENKIFSHTKTLIAKRQYTGLKDKNGVEIYEGDILRVYDDFNAKVFYNLRFSSFEVATTGNSVGFYSKSGLEVIGNIYENPELLS